MEIATTVSGIPCIARVTSYSAGCAARIWPIEHSHPEEPEEVEFEVCDRRGRPAPWLAKKLTDKECARIESELCAAIDESKYDEDY